MVCTFILPVSGAKPGACAENDQLPDFSPMIENRPLSSVVAVKLLGEAFGFSAVTVAPLMGLLGTVLGMIQAFNVISYAGASLKPIMLVGGISKALVTTAAGLVIAVPVLSVYSYFRGIVQDISNRVEMYSTDIMKLIEENAKHQ